LRCLTVVDPLAAGGAEGPGRLVAVPGRASHQRAGR
jgi:hypothetical protein